MKWIQRAYSLVLKLYPLAFQKRFGVEMEDVFHIGLVTARKQGVLIGFVLSELLRLPGSLLSVYVWTMREGAGKPVTVSNTVGGGTAGLNIPSEGWGSSLLSGLPHLLMGALVISSTLAGSRIFPALYVQAALYSAILLGVLIFCIVNGWKRWSASWIFYTFFVLLILLNLAMNSLSISISGENYRLYNLGQVLFFPLLLAYLLYRITCKDRMQGVLAAIPPMVIIWTYFLEFVPEAAKSLAWAGIFLLAFLASVLILRIKHILPALGLAMAVPLFGGIPFAYLGVNQGGTLPFIEPGPSLLEVIRQYLPFLVMTFAIVLGPQLAVKLRSIGIHTAKAGGKVYYRLVLGGIFLGFVYVLLQWINISSGTHLQSQLIQAILITAVILYVIGFALQLWAVNQSKSPAGDYSKMLELGLLFLPLLFMPLAIVLAFSLTMGNVKNWLVLMVEIGWVIASILVVRE
jgi:hypothetical protein